MTRRGGHPRRPTFAETLARQTPPPPPAAGPDQPGTRPIQDRHWTDADGTAWQVRGAAATVRRIEYLLPDPQTRVLLVYGPGPPREIPLETRSELWARVRPYYTGRVSREPGDMTDFEVREFRDARRHCLLIIQEYC